MRPRCFRLSARHVLSSPTPILLCFPRYEAPPGTWLQEQGFRGQEVHWSIFVASSPDTLLGAADLSGLNGERREFRELRWVSWDEIPAKVVPFKRAMYAAASRRGSVYRSTLAVFQKAEDLSTECQYFAAEELRLGEESGI